MKIKIILVCISIFMLAAFSLSATGASETLDPKAIETLGKNIYFDDALSSPRGMSCASCHDPGAGFADPNTNFPVSRGVIHTRFGNRNSPTAAYAAYSPDFSFNELGEAVGGQFWDGRAKNLTEQAKGPFLNPLEMHNRDKSVVVTMIKNSGYAGLFIEVYPSGFADDDAAYHNAALAIAAYENSSEVNKFSSKYDYLTEEGLEDDELRGFELFEANCAGCHPSDSSLYADSPLFTDYGYRNLGVPRNPDNPFYSIAFEFNPEKDTYVDYGLGAALGDESQNGKMKTPTLRNIARTPPYMHNGVFADLPAVLEFLNDREPYTPEVNKTINENVGNFGFTDQDIADLIAFLNTLSDGYEPSEA